MRITETFSPDCRSSTIVLDNKPHCNGSSTLTAFDPATGRAAFAAQLLVTAALHAVLAAEAKGRSAVMCDRRVQIARSTSQLIAASRVDGRIKASLHIVTLAL